MPTATIYLAYEVSEEAEARVRALLDKVLWRDPNWGGAEFEVCRDDHTYVECRDEIAGAKLLYEIFDEIGPRD